MPRKELGNRESDRDWILSLDADEELDGQLQQALAKTLESLERIEALRRQTDAHPLMVEGTQAELADCVGVKANAEIFGISIPRKNYFLGRWIRRRGFWPDPKLRRSAAVRPG